MSGPTPQEIIEQAKAKGGQADRVETERNTPKTYCNACNKIKFPIHLKKCACKPMGGGGGGGDDSCDDALTDAIANTDGESIDADYSDSDVESTLANNDVDCEYATQEIDLDNHPFNTDTISYLLDHNILHINNDKSLGTIHIKVMNDPQSLLPEQRHELKKFFQAIFDELEEFKDSKNISAKCHDHKKDVHKNFLYLTVILPTPALHEEFVLLLAGKQLLPLQNINQQGKPVYERGVNHFHPTPLSTKLMPGARNTADDEDLKLLNAYNRTPFAIDGPKPKGWKS